MFGLYSGWSQQLKEVAACTLLILCRSSKRNASGVLLLCSNDLLRRPIKYIAVPLINTVVVHCTSRSNLALEVAVLLNCICNLLVRLQLRISLYLREQTTCQGIHLRRDRVTIRALLNTAAECCNACHHILIELNSTINQAREVLENNYTLLNVVVNC